MFLTYLQNMYLSHINALPELHWCCIWSSLCILGFWPHVSRNSFLKSELHVSMIFKIQFYLVLLHVYVLYVLYNLCLSRPEAGGWWNTKGCEVVSKHYGYTVCYCNHTTNFALLLQVYETQVTCLCLTGVVDLVWFPYKQDVYVFKHRMHFVLHCARGAQRMKKLCRCWRSLAVECLCVASSSPSSSSLLWGE